MADLPCNQSNPNITVWNAITEAEWDALFTYPAYVATAYLTPIMYAMGIPANMIAFYIWLRPRMRQSSGIYLAALAVANFGSLVLTIVRSNNAYHVYVWCEIFIYIAMVFQYLSPLLVLGYTVERYISVCHPFKRDKFCTQRRAVITVACMCVGTALVATPQLYFWNYVYYPKYEQGLCEQRKLTVEDEAKWVFGSEMIMFGAVSLAVLIFNMIVICETNRVMRAVNVRKPGKTMKYSATTFTLLLLSFYLVASSFLSSIVYCIKHMNIYPMGDEGFPCVQYILDDPTWRVHFKFYNVDEISRVFTLSYYASGFYIYIFTSSMFKREFRVAILGKLGVVKADDETVTGTTEWYTKYGANLRASSDPIREIGSGTSVSSTGIERDVQPEMVSIDDSPRRQEGLEISRPSATRMADISLTSLPDGNKTNESGGRSKIDFSKKRSTNVDMAMSSRRSDGSLRRYISGSRTSVTSNEYKATSIKQAFSNTARGQATKRTVSHRSSLGMPTTTTRDWDSVKSGRRRFTLQGEESASPKKQKNSVISMSSLNK